MSAPLLRSVRVKSRFEGDRRFECDLTLISDPADWRIAMMVWAGCATTTARMTHAETQQLIDALTAELAEQKALA